MLKSVKTMCVWQKHCEAVLSRLYAILVAALLAGCTNLPVDGPAHYDIARGATASLVADRRAVAYDYVLVDITQNVIDITSVNIGLGSFYKSFGAKARHAPAISVGTGDVLQVTVFESSAGGLFLPPEAGVRTGNFVSVPPQTVGQSGSITVPYAGEIRAAGRTPQAIKTDIEKKLSSRAVEPQVVVTLVEQSSTAVSLVGELGSNRVQIRPNERVLDVLARSGGFRFPGYELFVTLQRHGGNSTVYFPTLISDPRENIYVMPGDTIYVYREQQKFVAVGALGNGTQTQGLTGLFAFEQERLSFNEALAKAGGLLDTRANASNVFLYRQEYREALDVMGVDTHMFPPNQKFIPTIYRANFRDPSSFFFAQRFQMRHKDAIYVANSDSIELEKFLFHTQAISSTIAGTATDIVTTRDAVRALGN